MLRAKCPHCGKPNNHRESSIDTVVQCGHCKSKYELSRSVRKSGGCLSCGVIFLLCFMGLVFASVLLQSDNQPEQRNENSRPPIHAVKQSSAAQPNGVEMESGDNSRPMLDVASAPAASDTFKEEQERKAQAKLRLAKKALDDGFKTLARNFLSDVLNEYGETDAAKEAKLILDGSFGSVPE